MPASPRSSPSGRRYIAGGGVAVQHILQPRAVMGCGMGDGPAADQAALAINADVVFVAERGHGNVDLWRAVFTRPGLGEFHRPARVAVLPRQLGGLVHPVRRNVPGLDRRPLSLGVALLRRRHDGGVDDLPAHCQITRRLQRGIEAAEQRIHRIGAPQRLAERPDRVGIRHRLTQTKAETAHERRPVLDQILGALVRQAMHCLQQQDLEHQPRIEGRATTLRAV